MSTLAPERPDLSNEINLELYDPGLYPTIEGMRAGAKFNKIVANLGARSWEAMTVGNIWIPDTVHRAVAATEEFYERAAFDYSDPGYNIETTTMYDKEVRVTEKVVDEQSYDYGYLTHFEAETDLIRPILLVETPVAGHFGSYVKKTIQRLLVTYDVYASNAVDVKNVPVEAGSFGLEDSASLLENYTRYLGKDVTVVSICQATVPGLMSQARIAETDSGEQPLATILIAGPIDVDAAPGVVADFAKSVKIEQIGRSEIARVPSRYPGADQLVKPGVKQVGEFILMDAMSHIEAEQDIIWNRINNNDDEAQRIIDQRRIFYASLDMASQFFQETVKYIFQESRLAAGTLQNKGSLVDLSALDRPEVLIIEGLNDKITTPGHTAAAADLLTGMDPKKIKIHRQPGVGHTGAFSGKVFDKEIATIIEATTAKALIAAGLEDKYYFPPLKLADR